MSTTAEDHDRMGRKRHKTDMGEFYQGYYHLLCFKTEGKYIKSVIFILFHDFIKQAQGYSLLHLEANKNPYLSELMFFQENEEK